MLGEIEDITAAHGVHQVLHPHVNTLVETADELDRVLQASDVSICLDTGHVTIGGADPLDLAERFAPRVGLVHLKDVRDAGRGAVQRRRARPHGRRAGRLVRLARRR